MRVACVTTSRSDYGPWYWVLHELFRDPRFEPLLLVGGAHLSTAAGNTVEEIERDGWPITGRVPFLDTSGDSARATAAALAGFSERFVHSRPDLIVLYGDRFELLPIATAAVLTRTPLAHLCGGDVTEGALDEQIRHAVTKMAHVHLTSSARSARRILQMGEEAWRVHDVGDPALDHFRRSSRAGDEELTAALGFVPDATTLLVTFHPPTLTPERAEVQARALAAALEAYPGRAIITGPAPDPGSDAVRSVLRALARTRPGTVFVESLGSHRYRGVLTRVGAVVGNSSSGLIEAACVPVPAVNVGDRQAGRDRGGNVIDVAPDRDRILDGIARALSPAFRAGLASLQNPYGDGEAAGRIVSVLADLPDRERLLRKRFVLLPSPDGGGAQGSIG
jgi:UDP-hydrolysing UDP-N-acetyl-D-glucosamine 2-epimerase